jgi:hypothetical protein
VLLDSIDIDLLKCGLTEDDKNVKWAEAGKMWVGRSWKKCGWGVRWAEAGKSVGGV